jgi:hypothetical protein
VARPTKRELALFSLPPEGFVAARDALAKELRSEGKRDHAARVAKLRKPTVPAWAINRAANDDPGAAEQLLASADRLAKAQRGAGAGGGGRALRDAMSEHSAAIEAVMGAVAGVLVKAGHDGTANLDRARDTLRAVATDAELRREFEQRRISRDREAVGFGTAPPPSGRGASAGAKGGDQKAGAAAKRERERRAAKRELAVATRRVERAAKKLDRARAAVDAAREKLDAAESARSDAAEELGDAESAEREAREALE